MSPSFPPEPAHPSHPPPPPDKSVRPMSALGAAGWTLAATVLFLWLVGLTLSLRPGAEQNIVNAFGCQALAYLIVLFFILRVHAPEVSIRALLGLRRTAFAFYPLGVALGVSVGLPANFLYAQTVARFPRPAEEVGLVQSFLEAGGAKRAGIALIIIALGPFLEEVFYRGALFRPLRGRHGVVATCVLTGMFFGLAHMPWQSQIPIAFVGVTLALVRHWSGALGPAIAMHAAFNAVGVAQLYLSPRLDFLDAPAWWLVAVGTAVSGAVLFAAQSTARASQVAQIARQRDVEEV